MSKPNPNVRNTLLLLGRLLLAAMFVWAAIGKLMDAGAMAEYAQMEPWVMIVAGILELVGAVVLVFGFGMVFHVAAVGLAIYLIVLTFIFHWPIAGDVMQQGQFLKNMAMLGGLFYAMGCGAGRFSVIQCNCGCNDNCKCEK